MLLDAGGRVLHRPIAWHDARGAAEAQALARDLPDFTAAHRPARQRAVLAGQAQAPRHATARRAGSTSASGSCTASAAARSPSSRSPRAPACSTSSPPRPTPTRSRGPGLPDDLLAELVLAGTDAGRSDGAALPGTDGAVLTVAGHDHLVAGVGVGVIAPGDVLDSCGTAEALVRVAPPLDAAARRRSVAGRRDRRLARGRRPPGAAGRGCGPASPCARCSTTSGLGESDREELSAGALAIAPGDAPALELELHSLERPPVRLPAAAPAAVWRGAIDAVAREVEALIAHVDAVAGPHTQARRHRRLGARRRRLRRQAPPRRHRDAAGRRGRLPRRRAALRRRRRPLRQRRRPAGRLRHRKGARLMPEPLLEARGIVKSFGRVRALRGANFAVYPNEVVALVGDNGAGKSTLVKTLAGVHQPDAGEILFEGQPVELHSPLDARRAGDRDRLPGPRAGGRARRRRQHVPRPRGDAPRPARQARVHRQAGDARPEPRRVQEPRRRAAGHRRRRWRRCPAASARASRSRAR